MFLFLKYCFPHRSMPTTPPPQQCSSTEADRQQEGEDENECAENTIETEVEEPARVSDIQISKVYQIQLYVCQKITCLYWFRYWPLQMVCYTFLLLV